MAIAPGVSPARASSEAWRHGARLDAGGTSADAAAGAEVSWVAGPGADARPGAEAGPAASRAAITSQRALTPISAPRRQRWRPARAGAPSSRRAAERNA